MMFTTTILSMLLSVSFAAAAQEFPFPGPIKATRTVSASADFNILPLPSAPLGPSAIIDILPVPEQFFGASASASPTAAVVSAAAAGLKPRILPVDFWSTRSRPAEWRAPTLVAAAAIVSVSAQPTPSTRAEIDTLPQPSTIIIVIEPRALPTDFWATHPSHTVAGLPHPSNIPLEYWRTGQRFTMRAAPTAVAEVEVEVEARHLLMPSGFDVEVEARSFSAPAWWSTRGMTFVSLVAVPTGGLAVERSTLRTVGRG
ncbi:hypothetical protein P153DRAFT_367275 [Dothidotthia symphoricarpi CBS 119687]|uniref:Uncharacterized protein n=1 Tax=Dothidotthia symphoricarpi CBS 119687 TaxID=1392245 RepID=A0A6A6AF03_9PLEO|nr:uncharacterized protein P153DRAFT_367275 [Dothidotthia symphoricarpi CBS 119687]KAF2128991.1 hypothetical protein P153DRAFT_367275 [Dothidotthia symphoricarpi CBS 119687]